MTVKYTNHTQSVSPSSAKDCFTRVKRHSDSIKISRVTTSRELGKRLAYKGQQARWNGNITLSRYYFRRALAFDRRNELVMLHLCSIGVDLLPGQDVMTVLTQLSTTALDETIRADAFTLLGNNMWGKDMGRALKYYEAGLKALNGKLSTPKAIRSAAFALCGIGAAHLEFGNRDLARVKLLESIDLDDRIATAHANLASCYLEIGNIYASLKEIKVAITLERKNELAIDLLIRIGKELGDENVSDEVQRLEAQILESQTE